MSALTPSTGSSKASASDRGSSLEPSPASTYGDSAASGSPQTPAKNDGGANLTDLVSNMSSLSFGYEGTDKHKQAKVDVYSPPFGSMGAQTMADDPFTSTSPRRGTFGSGQITPTGPKSKGRAGKSDNWRSGSSSGSSNGRSSPSPSRFLVGKRGSTLFLKQYNTEADLAMVQQAVASDDDAPSLMPPSACIFVANLLQSESDESLHVAVTHVFREFGSVWVKIRRDAKHMPFAFAQYRFPEEAEKAIREGRGRLINGRPCRCEKAKAHRLFFIERKYGTVLTVDEANHLLRPFGPTDFVRQATAVECAQLNLNEGIMVQFQVYDDGQAAFQVYRSHELFKMQSLANMGSRGTPYGGSDPAHRRYLETYEVDKRSIYVGNLPINITEEVIQKKFEEYGRICKVNILQTTSKVDANSKHCFGFVEFFQSDSVILAINDMNGQEFLGQTIRVAQKDSMNATDKKKPVRSAPSASAASYQSPSHPSLSQQPTTPMAPVSPSSFGSPYAYGYGYPPLHYTDGHGNWYSSSPWSYYPPQQPFHGYAGSLSPSSNADSAGSPTQQMYGGYYPQWATAASPQWGPPSASPQYGGWATDYPLPGYTATADSSTVVPEDRSVTPTPTGHTAAAESAMEAQ